MTYKSYGRHSKTVVLLNTKIAVGDYSFLGVNDNGDVVAFTHDTTGIQFLRKHGEWVTKIYYEEGVVIGKFNPLPPEYESGKVYADLEYEEGVNTFPIIED